MSEGEDKQVDNDPERTLITLDQLSQTIEVMTSVVNRLRQHLSEQLRAQAETQRQSEQANTDVAVKSAQQAQATGAANEKKKESFVVEINQQESAPVRKNGKVLH